MPSRRYIYERAGKGPRQQMRGWVRDSIKSFRRDVDIHTNNLMREWATDVPNDPEHNEGFDLILDVMQSIEKASDRQPERFLVVVNKARDMLEELKDLHDDAAVADDAEYSIGLLIAFCNSMEREIQKGWIDNPVKGRRR